MRAHGWGFLRFLDVCRAGEALHEIGRTDPEERAAIRADADRILRADVIELRVQLVDPIGFWQTHTVSDCFGLAPVFAWRFDDLPPRR